MYNNEDIRYKLERYRAGGSNRYVCPQCGRKKCFTRYVDVETGEYVGEDCGKCNHTASCGYHYPPREFFRDHPELRRKDDYQTEYVNGKQKLNISRKSQGIGSLSLKVGQTDMGQTEFFDFEWVRKAMFRKSTFRLWLEKLMMEKLMMEKVVGGDEPGMSDAHIQSVLDAYYVGGTAKDVVIGGVNYGPAVVFWLIDEQQRVHDAKLMAYRKDGHRVQGWANSMRSICERSHVGPQLLETEKVLFGLHLLPRYPEKTVCIVESEKTAIICACRYPDCLWLATGGCGNLQERKLLPLKDRKLVVYPDSGEYEKWKECMARSGHANYHVVDFMEQYEPNTDIADILLGEAKQKPEIFLPPPTEVCPF